jgi:hypothetical protein
MQSLDHIQKIQETNKRRPPVMSLVGVAPTHLYALFWDLGNSTLGVADNAMRPVEASKCRS